MSKANQFFKGIYPPFSSNILLHQPNPMLATIGFHYSHLALSNNNLIEGTQTAEQDLHSYGLQTCFSLNI